MVGMAGPAQRSFQKEPLYADEERVALAFGTEAAARKIVAGSLTHFTSAHIPLSKVTF